MNKHLWFSVPCLFSCSELVFAATVTCSLAPVFNAERTTGTINNFNNYTERMVDDSSVGRLTSCDNQMAVRSNFKAVSGRTNLTATGSGSFPFGVDSNIVINNSDEGTAAQNLAKVWLSDNLKMNFFMSDDVISNAVVSVKVLDQDYNIHPNASQQSGRVMINGEEYLHGGSGLRNAGFSVRNVGITLINKVTPSSRIIDALTGATVRIRLGTMSYKYDNYSSRPPTNIPKTASTDVYLNLKLSFARPTCTMDNQSVNLATVPIGILNSAQTGGEQDFNITINCTTSMSRNTLLARVTDSYTPDNSNSNGILKNQPSLANKSNVDVQLLDEANQPLNIGIQAPFYNVPATTATRFIKTLKARYFRSALRATAGYVQTQATVFLDYQ